MSTTAGYRVSLALVACALVVVPVIYLAAIVFIGWGTYWYATEFTWLIVEPMNPDRPGRRRSGFGWFLLYIGPILAGFIMLVFLVKPLFKRARRTDASVEVTAEEQPALFALIDGIVSVLGAARPAAVRVDCEANASVRLDHHPLNFFGRRVSLQIGLPLAVGLSARELAGVLAHEFGHFTQRAGMRASGIIGSITWWLVRLVYERDALDRAIDSMRGEGVIGAVYGCVLGAPVYLVRGFSWLLLMAANAISCAFLRQMEYDADRVEATLIGVRAYESARERMRAIGMARQWTESQLQSAWIERRLSDDLPGLVVATIGRLESKWLDEAREADAARRTRWFDSHPAPTERLRNVVVLNTPGVFTLEAPATALLTNLAALCREATLRYYRHEIGLQVSPDNLKPVAEFHRVDTVEFASGRAARRYFQSPIAYWVTLGDRDDPSPEAPMTTLDACRRAIEQARTQVLDASDRVRQVIDALHAARHEGINLAAAMALRDIPIRFRPRDFKVPSRKPEAIRQAIHANRQEQARLLQILAQNGPPLHERIACVQRVLRSGLSSLPAPRCAKILAGMTRIVRLVDKLNELDGAVCDMVEQWSIITVLDNAPKPPTTRERNRLEQRVDEAVRALFSHAQRVIQALKSHHYPLQHAKAGLSVADYAFEDPAPEGRAAAQWAHDAVDRLSVLHGRLLGRLAVLCEEVESALGLEPLPEPPDVSAGSRDES